jgi:hypothetical protein
LITTLESINPLIEENMQNILGYYVYDAVAHEWLADSENGWTGAFHGAACFTDAKLAQDIGDRENKDGNRTLYVMALMQTIS